MNRPKTRGVPGSWSVVVVAMVATCGIFVLACNELAGTDSGAASITPFHFLPTFHTRKRTLGAVNADAEAQRFLAAGERLTTPACP
jgi:hypothetical protein